VDVRSRGPAHLIALWCGGGFLLLSLLVAVHATNHADVVWRGVFRPDDEWGPLQIRMDHVVEGLRPPVMALFLTIVATIWAVHRRSLAPLAFAAVLGLCAIVASGGTKLLMARPDPHGQVTGHTGSYPSGHTVSVIVCLGGALLLTSVRTRWWEWLFIALVGALMGFALVAEGAHWVTDVVGGALLGTALVAAASTWRLRRMSVSGASLHDLWSDEHPRSTDDAPVGDLAP